MQMLRQAFLLFFLVDAGLLFGTSPRWLVPNAGIPPERPLPASENLAIVVNRSNPVENLSTSELRRIFLGERGHWPNGRRITIVMMEPGQPERDVVLRDVFRMTETEFSNHFLHGVFTGEVLVSPKTLATPVGVRKFVFNVPGAIGYLRASDVDASVKVLRIDERYPDDKAYPFHVPPQPAN
jgi:ABC-type phosphate transport system substrate-binding protein